ncbi:hypothetical protein [Neobacillus sp. FSL H8-0543]|uniref:hypothetical protein n=1 Tax=Neobacillus sp. FSL H8-0543 TaxID=2954672 RepID=UPI003158A86D
MKKHFTFDQRLGISLPDLKIDWEHYDLETQNAILFCWEQIRGSIPDRIQELENNINEKQEQLSIESSFVRSCELNNDIAGLASIINDLWLWYRANQVLSEKAHQ